MPSTVPVNWSELPSKFLLLIAAQSGRFLAQIAHRSGFQVRVADQFADTDTLIIAEKHLRLPDFNQLTDPQFLSTIANLADGQPAILIIGTGLERFFDCLNHLPANIHSANNCFQTIYNCVTPHVWFDLLTHLSISYPASQFSRPNEPDNYLQKPVRHWGGVHITRPSAIAQPDVYYQQKIYGISASVLFIADGKQARLISLNQQYCRAPARDDYRLQAITNNLMLNEKQQQWLVKVCLKLSKSLALRGFQSLDFIIDEHGQCWVLELNPRPSASLQCLPKEWPLLHWHIGACNGQLPTIDNMPSIRQQLCYYVYAEQHLVIPERFEWPEYAADLPAAGSQISRDQIVCSLLVPCDSNDPLTLGQNLATNLQLKLQLALEKPVISAI